MHWTLGGSSRGDLDEWTARFVPRAAGAWRLRGRDGRRSPSTSASGDVLVLMSASVDLYVPAIGRAARLRRNHLHRRVDGTGIGSTAPDHAELPGAGESALLRGPAYSASRDLQTAAYGNAGSDLPHLRLADRGVLVNGDEPRAAKRRGGCRSSTGVRIRARSICTQRSNLRLTGGSMIRARPPSRILPSEITPPRCSSIAAQVIAAAWRPEPWASLSSRLNCGGDLPQPAGRRSSTRATRSSR